MGCLYQLSKVAVIIINLVGFGCGYAKFYQMFSSIGKSIKDIGNTNSFEDLVWVPYLTVHVCSTFSIITIVYCLIRELCEDFYMFNHCFKCCFILTILIYCISVLPKSIINIIYHNYDISIDEWWSRFTDALDSCLAGLGALGFQLILFSKVIMRVCRSAGMCKGKSIHPDRQGLDELGEHKESSGCCLVCCIGGNKNNASDHTSGDKQSTIGKTTVNKNQKVKVLYDKGSNAIKKGVAKVKRVDEKLEKKKQDVTTRLQNETKKQTDKVKKAAKQKAKKIKISVVSVKPKICRICHNDITAEYEEQGDSITNDTKNESRICLKCDTLKEDTTDAEESNSSTCCQIAVCVKCSQYCSSLLNNRLKCFVITIVLANIHFFVYIIELVFIICFIC